MLSTPILKPSRSLPTYATAGIVSYVPPLAASVAVSLATKILPEEDIENAMICFGARILEFEKVKITRRENCPTS
ncbi:MAG: hypothetical protein J7K58_02275 [Euryarchaeota archaeon]|nr:hypothetical protein [Euryarchaeota archaeon]